MATHVYGKQKHFKIDFNINLPKSYAIIIFENNFEKQIYKKQHHSIGPTYLKQKSASCRYIYNIVHNFFFINGHTCLPRHTKTPKNILKINLQKQ